jgi:hypothetical protein
MRVSKAESNRAFRLRLFAPVAQLDRALAYEARGREFESLRAYQSSQVGLVTSMIGSVETPLCALKIFGPPVMTIDVIKGLIGRGGAC